MDGWIKLHRDILEWEWYDNHKVKAFFIHCLLKANFEKKRWRGIEIPTGAFVTSLSKLSQETGLTIGEIRTCLSKLISSGEIEKLSLDNMAFTFLRVCNYSDYQKLETNYNKDLTKKGQRDNKQITRHQQTSNTVTTTTNKDKNDNNSINKEEISMIDDFSRENELIHSILNFFDVDIIQNLNESDKEKWLTEIRYLNQNDGYSYELIQNVITWARQHDFWSTNLLTLDGISKKNGGVSKFKKILKQYEQKITKENFTNNEKSNEYAELAREIYEDSRLS